MSHPLALVRKVQNLRTKGRTYTEIRQALRLRIPKSTLSSWCQTVKLPAAYVERLAKVAQREMHRGRRISLAVRREQRFRYLRDLFRKNFHFTRALEKPDTSKLLLATLYLCEGSKRRQGSLTFGNSDPFIIRLFLRLLRQSYLPDERKFRCTVQCRADQNIAALERRWSVITKIPRRQFYSARIDPRTSGIRSRQKNYLGVCRLDCFSAHIYHELTVMGNIITGAQQSVAGL